MDIDALIRKLHLEPLPSEGGLFYRTYLSPETIPAGALPERYPPAERHFGSAIYYLFTDDPDSFSAMHCLLTDEVYHFYLGDPVETLILHPDGRSEIWVLGPDILNDQTPQFVVPANCWQGSCLAEGGKFALIGTTMAPAFDWRDFTLGYREELTKVYPQARQRIEQLTRG